MEDQIITDAGRDKGTPALIVGIAAVITAIFPCTALFSFGCSIIAIALGIKSLKEAKRGNGKLGLSKAGIILGIIATIISLAWWIGVIIFGNR